MNSELKRIIEEMKEEKKYFNFVIKARAINSLNYLYLKSSGSGHVRDTKHYSIKVIQKEGITRVEGHIALRENKNQYFDSKFKLFPSLDTPLICEKQRSELINMLKYKIPKLFWDHNFDIY